MSSESAETFQQKVCRYYDVPMERYEEIVLGITLYPHAGWVEPIAPRQIFSADRAFVAGVGRLTRWRAFDGEVEKFREDAQNKCFARRVLCMRVSVSRMRVLFSKIWG